MVTVLEEMGVPKEDLLEVGDGVPMWGLGLTGLWMPGLRRLEAPATFFLGRWFHPIRRQGKPFAYAESTLIEGGNELHVPAIGFDATLARTLNESRKAHPTRRMRVIHSPELGHVQAVWAWMEQVAEAEIRVAPIEGRPEMKVGEMAFINWIRGQDPILPDTPSKVAPS